MKIKTLNENNKRIDKVYYFSMDEVAKGEMQTMATQIDSCKKFAHSQGGGRVEWSKWYNFEKDEFALKVSYIFDEA